MLAISARKARKKRDEAAEAQKINLHNAIEKSFINSRYNINEILQKFTLTSKVLKIILSYDDQLLKDMTLDNVKYILCQSTSKGLYVFIDYCINYDVLQEKISCSQINSLMGLPSELSSVSMGEEHQKNLILLARKKIELIAMELKPDKIEEKSKPIVPKDEWAHKLNKYFLNKVILNNAKFSDVWHQHLELEMNNEKDQEVRFIKAKKIINIVDAAYRMFLLESWTDIARIKASAKDEIHFIITLAKLTDIQEQQIKSQMVQNPKSAINYRLIIPSSLGGLLKPTKTAMDFADSGKEIELGVIKSIK